MLNETGPEIFGAADYSGNRLRYDKGNSVHGHA
jgi:hypothetical protein